MEYKFRGGGFSGGEQNSVHSVLHMNRRWCGVTGATYIILGQCAKDGQVVDPYRALERVAQASLGDRHAGPNGGRLFRRVTSADTCHGQGKFLRAASETDHRARTVAMNREGKK
uniref:Uncharacterized protein n=1 Tax=Anopheles merus TaxID=30066 RepID=A0A182VJC5_ANOME